MSNLAIIPDQLIEERRQQLSEEVLELWNPLQGREWYALQCPCLIDCQCMPENVVPRLRIHRCYFPGELDFYFVTQPFYEKYGFKLWWHCNKCNREMSCGTPYDVKAALNL